MGDSVELELTRLDDREMKEQGEETRFEPDERPVTDDRAGAATNLSQAPIDPPRRVRYRAKGVSRSNNYKPSDYQDGFDSKRLTYLVALLSWFVMAIAVIPAWIWLVA